MVVILVTLNVRDGLVRGEYFLEFSDVKHFKGFQKSHDENPMSKITRHNRGGGADDSGKFHKKNVFFY